MKPVLIRSLFIALHLMIVATSSAQPDVLVKKGDRKKDIQMKTDSGILILRLSDATPLHRDNFIKLVKSKYYNDIAFNIAKK
jgi:peptidyl-prolyl cis-trans isomerase B (cyclophilin B)